MFVDTKTGGASIKVTGCNDTDERQSWVYTLKGQIMVCVGYYKILNPSHLAWPISLRYYLSLEYIGQSDLAK